MSEERLEKLCNKMYYDYLEKEEAQEIINYIHLLEEENKQLKKEKDTLYNALITTRTKYNNDKAKYRRKAKRYRNILTELEEYLTKITKNGADIEKITCSNILVYLKELKEKYK